MRSFSQLISEDLKFLKKKILFIRPFTSFYLEALNVMVLHPTTIHPEGVIAPLGFTAPNTGPCSDDERLPSASDGSDGSVDGRRTVGIG